MIRRCMAWADPTEEHPDNQPTLGNRLDGLADGSEPLQIDGLAWSLKVDTVSEEHHVSVDGLTEGLKLLTRTESSWALAGRCTAHDLCQSAQLPDHKFGLLFKRFLEPF